MRLLGQRKPPQKDLKQTRALLMASATQSDWRTKGLIRPRIPAIDPVLLKPPDNRAEEAGAVSRVSISDKTIIKRTRATDHATAKSISVIRGVLAVVSAPIFTV